MLESDSIMSDIADRPVASPNEASSKRIPDLAARIALVLVLLATYGAVLLGLFRDWVKDPNYSHGFLIPLVSGFFLWKGRRAFALAPRRPSLLGLGGILVAVAMLI